MIDYDTQVNLHVEPEKMRVITRNDPGNRSNTINNAGDSFISFATLQSIGHLHLNTRAVS
jgi:hypothetical protein